MDSAQLEQECRSFTRYLIGQPPTAYVIEKYQDFHQKIGAPPLDAFDAFLVSAAARGPFRARLADSYAGRFRPNSAVRRKLVVTLALLECTPPNFETLDRVPAGGLTGAILRLGLGTLGYVCTLAAAGAIFTPVRLWMGVRAR